MLVVCGSTALVGAVVGVGGGGTGDGVVRCGVPCGLGGPWGWLRWGVVVLQLVGVAVVLGHRGVGVGGDGCVVVVLVVLCPLALREWWSLHGVDVCGPWSLPGLPG